MTAVQRWMPGPWRWFPRRCVDCSARHLNGPRVALPVCRGCWSTARPTYAQRFMAADVTEEGHE